MNAAADGGSVVETRRRPRVLVVDENRSAAETLQELLELEGFSTTVAFDGAAALAAVDGDSPDAVLLGLGMHDINGFEVCRRIRGATRRKQPLLVALSGWADAQDRNFALGVGFDGHLAKPARSHDVASLLDELFRRGEHATREPAGLHEPSASR